MTDLWVTKFPSPGPAPARPPDGTLDPDVTTPYNNWVSAQRKHNVANAVDALIAREKYAATLNSAETIALTLGLMLLDGSIRDHDTGLPGMLGMF